MINYISFADRGYTNPMLCQRLNIYTTLNADDSLSGYNIFVGELNNAQLKVISRYGIIHGFELFFDISFPTFL